MPGLIGVRLLKWFIGSISRKPTSASPTDEGSGPENEEGETNKSSLPEAKETRRKEESKDNERRDRRQE